MTRKQQNSWRSLNRRLTAMSEDELQALLDAEVVGQKRVFVAERLHQRLSAVRTLRERQELMEKLDARLDEPYPPAVA